MALDDRLQYDVVLVGGSSSNLALAHQLVTLAQASGVKFSMAILEKSREFGGHVVSGAVSSPHVIQKLFPNWEADGFPIEGICNESHFSILGARKMWDVPGLVLPQELDKTGCFILSLSQVIAWMVDQLKARIEGSDTITIDFYPGFAAHDILYDEADRVKGVRVSHSGIEDDDYVLGKVTVFGDKGFISQDLIKKFNLRKNPQLWSVGIKETWQINQDLSNKVWHTLGFPVLDGTFGGGFVYGMKNNRLTIGLVISLDGHNPTINPQQCLQRYKTHPWIQSLLEGGSLIKYGAALLPEGGYFSLPDKFAVDGAMLLGDALGTLNVIKLAGIDMAMECGIQAAEVIHEALHTQDFSEATLMDYQVRLGQTFVIQDLHKSRYFRYAFMENPKLLGTYLPEMAKGVDSCGHPFGAAMKLGLLNPLTAPWDGLKAKLFIDGYRDVGFVTYKKPFEDYQVDFKEPVVVQENTQVAKDTIYSREDAVFYAGTKYHEGNDHIEEFDANLCMTCISKYEAYNKVTPCVADCTAEVHRIDEFQQQRKHGMSLENCIHCRTCEMVCPEENLRVKPTYQGSGPDFMGL